MGALSNSKHERFAQELAKGKTADEAYATAGYKPNRHNASRLKTNETITDRVAELQERAATKVEKTVSDIVQMLEEDRALARRIAQPGAAVTASMGIAKLLGLIVEKREHSGSIGVRHEDALNALR